MSTLSARQTIMLVALFVATSVGFIALDNRQALDPLRTGLHNLIVPVTDLFNRVDEPGSQTELQAEYDTLQGKYDKLLADYAQLIITAQEVEQLRALLNLQQSQPNVTFVSARVLYPDPTLTQKFVIIDKGSKDGVQTGMAVTDPNYYVGLVTEVSEESARVTFAIDATQSVGAEILNANGVGIAWGMWQQGGRIELRHVERGVTAEEGELVVTACASEARTAKVPCGLIIGKVGGPPETSNQGDTQTIPVLPVATFDNLKVVAVIVADEPNDGA